MHAKMDLRLGSALEEIAAFIAAKDRPELLFVTSNFYWSIVGAERRVMELGVSFIVLSRIS